MRFLTPISDRGGNEPYSDTNAPETLEMTTVASAANIPTPPAGRVNVAMVEGTAMFTYKTASGALRGFGQLGFGTNFSNAGFGVVAATTRAFAAANSMIWVPIVIDGAAVITGLRIKKGTGTTAANVIGALYSATGARLAQTSTVAEGTTGSAVVSLPFTATYNANPTLYWAGIIGSSTSADYFGWATTEYLGPALAATQGSFAAPSSFSPPATTATTATLVPYISTY